MAKLVESAQGSHAPPAAQADKIVLVPAVPGPRDPLDAVVHRPGAGCVRLSGHLEVPERAVVGGRGWAEMGGDVGDDAVNAGGSVGIVKLEDGIGCENRAEALPIPQVHGKAVATLKVLDLC